MWWANTGKPIFRVVVCLATVLGVTAALYALPLRDRPYAPAVVFFFFVFIISTTWGVRYAIFFSCLAAVAFSWLLPPIGRLGVSDLRDVFMLAAFLAMAIITSDLSSRARREARNTRRSENLDLIINTIPSLAWSARPDGTADFFNQHYLDFVGLSAEQAKDWGWTAAVHPDDLNGLAGSWQSIMTSGKAGEAEARLRRFDGEYRWFLFRANPLNDQNGNIVKWYGINTDIEDRKRAEDKLRRSESDLHEAQRISRTGSWRHDVASGTVIVSPEIHRIFGVQPDEESSSIRFWLSRSHPDDQQRFQELFERCESQKTDYEADYRIVLPDGTIKHLHEIRHPVLSQSGKLVEMIGTTIDVTEQWKARIELESAFEEIRRLKDQLHDENLALREQIDQAFMFEEIVGSSPALQTVLSSIVKVAPTDSTVLITGETGTGKELIARAIHKHSHRSGQAFISVNCASIPASLIASELFGHEKGAFTGAVQRRQGRFELAHAGTIFLDEVGELPAETQIALLRVLQERQFERVGGTRVLSTDVRVIAATNRDLMAAIAAGTFRADLFYRLNVFPIDVPPLRNRREDIPMLVEYFVKRYAEKTGKQIRNIDRNTLEQCQAYFWPGNIRELQNIVERSVILCAGDTFWIERAWLTSAQLPRAELAGPLPDTLQNQERKMIETALGESKGRVAGPRGAAAKLGIPRSTLDTKIKQLGINKHRFVSE
jgi:PAS domain S-box-containing protein